MIGLHAESLDSGAGWTNLDQYRIKSDD